MIRLAITGGTGFVGSNLIDMAVVRGQPVRALTRRPQPTRAGVEWIDGALDRPDSLNRLLSGADAVIHVAGVINGNREAFRLGNVAGTQAMVDAAARVGVERFVHVSSLAAREPQLSAYGWSKAGAEEAVIPSGGGWTIVRPPAIYGPGDRELLDLFRAARTGIVPLPPGGRLSVIAVSDLCRLLLDCLDQPSTRAATYEPDDDVAGGWSHGDFARAVGQAVGRRVIPLPVPQSFLRAGTWLDRRLRGAGAKLTPDRVAYFCHPDWTVTPHRRPPASIWHPQVPTPEGLAETARWYRAQGWLG